MGYEIYETKKHPIRCLSCGSLEVSGIYKIESWADHMWWDEDHKNFIFSDRDPGMDADVFPEQLERLYCRNCGKEWDARVERLRQKYYVNLEEENGSGLSD